jgi:hypothetical protein
MFAFPGAYQPKPGKNKKKKSGRGGKKGRGRGGGGGQNNGETAKLWKLVDSAQGDYTKAAELVLKAVEKGGTRLANPELLRDLLVRIVRAGAFSLSCTRASRLMQLPLATQARSQRRWRLRSTARRCSARSRRPTRCRFQRSCILGARDGQRPNRKP